MARVTLQTIADRVGVSRMTVSNAFSRPDQLSSELRERILAAADALGYSGPDPSARALARGTTGAVGVLLTDSLKYAFADEVATAFLGSIVDELAPTGFALTLLSSAAQGDMIPARDVPMDGALVYSCDTSSPAIAWLLRRKLPLVYVDHEPEPGHPSVNIDDRGGARAAAQHLTDLGHRRIAIVTWNYMGLPGLIADPLAVTAGHVTKQRMIGWMEALDKAGVHPTVIGAERMDADAGDLALRLLLDGDARPTAILCFCDALAQGVVRAAIDSGLRVPQDLSVVGFDDNPLAERMRPALTTVRQDVEAKGRAAAAALTTAIERSKRGVTNRARHVLLPTELVVRESTARAAPVSGRRS